MPGPGGYRGLAASVAIIGLLVVGQAAVAWHSHAGVAWVAGAVQVDAAAREDPLEFGEAVPDFSAPGLDGRRVSWNDAIGSPTALVVWASWCPHCQRDLPVMKRVAARFPTVKVLTVTTSIGKYDGPSPREFCEANGLTFPVAVDDGSRSLAVALGVYRYPTVFWVGPDGKVRAITQGELGEARLRDYFEKLAATAR